MDRVAASLDCGASSLENGSLEEERARIVATLRSIADSIERMPIHGVREPLTFVRSVTQALAAWSARAFNVPDETYEPGPPRVPR